MAESHPSNLELEAARTAEASRGVAEHIEACASCRARMQLLDALQAAMAPAPGAAIPGEREATILADALRRAQAASIHRLHARRAQWLVPVAAAATILAMFATVRLTERAPAPTASIAAVNPADLNRDGVVDIVDALLAARAIESGQGIPAALLVNGDARGVPERIAMRAVSLEARP